MLPVYFAQKAFVVHAGSLLAVRRSATDRHQPLRWEVPGGRLEASEDLEAHLLREVFEETGVRIVVGEPFFVWKWNIHPSMPDAPATIVAVARLCSAQTTELSASGRVEDDHLDLMEWVSLAEVKDRAWIPNMQPVLEAFLATVERRHRP